MSLHIRCAVLCRNNLDPLCFPDEMDTDEGGTDREKEKSDSERSEQRSERKRASDSDSMDVRVKTEKEEASTDGRDSYGGSYNRSFSDSKLHQTLNTTADTLIMKNKLQSMSDVIHRIY